MSKQVHTSKNHQSSSPALNKPVNNLTGTKVSSYFNIKLQSCPLILQQPFQRTTICTEMGNIERLSRPMFAALVIPTAVKIYSVVETSGCDPF
jgi:hypothetical protein